METQVEKIIKKAMIEKILLSNDVYHELEEKKEQVFYIIPELIKEDGFKQNNPWHIYDVWEHTRVALSKSDKDLTIRLALLLHDIGKPTCYQDDGEIRHFKGHSQESAKIAVPILERLGYSMKDTYDISYLILKHSSYINIDSINSKNLKTVKKLLQVQYCDAYAYNPERIKEATDRLDIVKRKIEELEKKSKEDKCKDEK